MNNIYRKQVILSFNYVTNCDVMCFSSEAQDVELVELALHFKHTNSLYGKGVDGLVHVSVRFPVRICCLNNVFFLNLFSVFFFQKIDIHA